MTPERWQHIDKLLEEALERGANERAAFLDQACAGDEGLRRKVEDLLAAHERAGSFIEAPALEAAAKARAEQARSMVGRQLDHYQILSLLGKGGMGEVYRARDTKIGREVAIKLLPAAYARDAERLRRFGQEARAAGMLNHPNILVVHDIGLASPESGGAPYIVSELLEGETLRARLNGSALAPSKAIDYALQIARGLGAAHEKGITHRDLKPENLFVTRDGRIKILDFGLAKLKPQALSGLAGTQAPTVAVPTAPGAIMGTVGYMSPEQASGEEADHRADIFSFGAILYEMLTGKRAFQGQTTIEVLNAILKEQPPELSETNAKINPALDKLVRHCLEKNPEHRFQAARDLGFVLEAMSAGLSTLVDSQPEKLPPTQPSTHWPSKVQRWWVVAATLLLATLGGTWAYFTRQSEPPPLQRFSILPPEKVVFAASQPPAISPDGRKVAFVGEDETGKRLLWVRALDSLEAKALPDTEGASLPFWSPDSRQLGFFTQEKLKTVKASGGPVQTLCNAEEALGGAWSRAGVLIFSRGPRHRLFSVSDKGGDAALLMSYDQTRKENSQRWPHFLSDGRHFLFQSLSNIPGNSGIYVGVLGERTTRQVLREVNGPIYMANNWLFFARNGVLLAQAFDERRVQVTGEPETIAQQISSTRLNSYFSVSEQGIVTYATGDLTPDSQLVWVDRSGKELGVIGAPGDFSFGAKLSLDGKQVAISRRAATPGGIDVWIYDVFRQTPLRLTDHPANDVVPLWSPDGSRIVFGSFRDLHGSLFIRNANSSGQDELLLNTNETTMPLDWSPDGKFILAFSLSPREDKDLWIVPVSGEKKAAPWKFKESEYDEYVGSFSPDGKWIAYTSTESGSTEVYVEPFSPEGQRAQGKWRISPAGGSAPLWRRDGRELFYITPELKMMAVSVQTTPVFTTSLPQPLFTLPNVGSWPLNYLNDVTKDGQRILIRRPVKIPAQAYTVVLNWTAGVKK